MADLELEDGTPLQLEDGTNLEAEGELPEAPSGEFDFPPSYAPQYPPFFPCPTWGYAERQSSFQRRTPMESGWKRQRKQWPQFGLAVNLTWVMGTDEFDNFSTWLESNGYDWFYIYLDDYGSGKVNKKIRLSTDIAFNYTNHDRVTATATGEIFREGEILNPDCVPVYFIIQPHLVVPRGTPCQVYECDSYEQAFDGLVLPTASNAWKLIDNTPGGTAPAIAAKGGIDLLADLGPTLGNTPVLADACASIYSGAWGSNSHWQDTGAVGKVPLTLSGSFGGIFANSGDVRLCTLGFYNETWVAFGINTGSSGRLIISGQGAFNTETFYTEWVGVLSGAFSLAVNYTLDGLGNWWFEPSVNGVKLPEHSGQLPNGSIFDVNENTRFLLGGAGTGSVRANYVYHIESAFTSDAMLAGLKDAWDQNQSGYVDPDPTCAAPDKNYLKLTIGGTGPITHQWYEDDVLMVGETNNTLLNPDPAKLYHVISDGACGGPIQSYKVYGDGTKL